MFTLRFEKNIWRGQPAGGRWSCNFLKLKAGSLYAKFMINGFYEYLINNSEYMDYYMMDYMTALAYNNFQEIKDAIEMCPWSSNKVYKLVDYLDNKFDESIWDELKENNNVFKLNHRLIPRKENIVGEMTFYGYLYNEYKTHKDK